MALDVLGGSWKGRGLNYPVNPTQVQTTTSPPQKRKTGHGIQAPGYISYREQFLVHTYYLCRGIPARLKLKNGRERRNRPSACPTAPASKSMMTRVVHAIDLHPAECKSQVSLKQRSMHALALRASPAIHPISRHQPDRDPSISSALGKKPPSNQFVRIRNGVLGADRVPRDPNPARRPGLQVDPIAHFSGSASFRQPVSPLSSAGAHSP